MNDNQDWANTSGEVAWHLIDRHADSWAAAGEMMDAFAASRHPALTARVAKLEARQLAGTVREPVNGAGWTVHWWNESMRLLLPDGMHIASHRHYNNGTIQLTIKTNSAQLAKGSVG